MCVTAELTGGATVILRGWANLPDGRRIPVGAPVVVENAERGGDLYDKTVGILNTLAVFAAAAAAEPEVTPPGVTFSP